MEALYHQTNRLLQQVAGEELGKLEQTINKDDIVNVEAAIESTLKDILSNCSRLEILVNKEPPHRRSSAKYKVNQLKYDYRHINNSLKIIQQRRDRRLQQVQERDALLSQSFTTNEASADTKISLDYSLQHHDRLQSTHRQMDDMLGAGSSILEGLRDQGSVLKGAKKKVLDIAATLGMSNTVMRLTERRGQQDWYILFGGMFLVLVFLYVLLRYF